MSDTIVLQNERTVPVDAAPGYMGRILRVDLTAGTLVAQPLPDATRLRQLWGGQALGLSLLLDELALDARPLGPEAVVVMLAGALTGTGLTPGGTKLTAVFLSPSTGYTLGRAATSGFFPTALRSAGYDGLVVVGVSDRPVYLYLDDGRAELRDASAVWGMGTRATEDTLRAAVGHPDARVACIGPAGEHGVPAAMLVNDYNHSAAHGLGAVFGSKRLKAIVARGTGRPRVYDRARLIAAGQRWRDALAPRAYTVAQKHRPGYGASWGALTKHNWRSTPVTDEARGFDRARIVLRPCFQCPRMCPWDAHLQEGDHAGVVGHFNAGSEWLDTFYNLDIKGPDVLYLAERSNDLGIECSHFANAAGVAFEAWEKGLLSRDRTDGLELAWGDAGVVEQLLEACARREGWLGNLLADGAPALAAALGGDAADWVVHVKGGSPAQHEWRPLIGSMLAEVVASGGMKPQGGGSESPPPDLAETERWGPLEPRVPEGWAHAHFLGERVRQFAGLMGVCWFAMNEPAPDGLNSIVDAFAAATGWDVTLEDALEAGHRSILLQGIFASQRGWTIERDWTDVGARFLEPIPDGKYAGYTVAPHLEALVREYHGLVGRDPIGGRPLPETLRRLGMDEYLEWAAR
jgi:aldehyde:ferredoxin oxidoreductase